MTAEQRSKSFAEREARLEARQAEQAKWEAEQARKLAEEERELRRVYEEARAAERERLEAEEKVRRAAERERQALAVQDWSWQEAMEMAWDRAEKVKEKEALRIERSTLGAVKSRQQRAEEKSLARSQISRMSSQAGSQAQSAAFASTTSRFGDKSTDELMNYVNPEERARRKTHQSMLNRSRKRAARLNDCATRIGQYARRRLAIKERKRRVRMQELHVAAPPLQAIVRGWKVRARLRWCAAIATLIQRWARGMLGRRLARWQRERVPTIQACARGLRARVAYRRVRNAAICLQSGFRGLVARSCQRALRADPERVRRWEILCRVRDEVDRVDGQLTELKAAREAEQDQLKLALAHESDKLGESSKAAPQVQVMLQQEKLAAKDAEEIAIGLSRTAALIGLLAQVPFARAADATNAVSEEVEWLINLTEQQCRRDELYKPSSHRIADLFGSPTSKNPLTRDEQLDSYRSVGMGGGGMAVEPESPEPLTEAEMAAERARRAAARRVTSAGGAAPIKLGAFAAQQQQQQQPKKWTGKGPPPPGWNKVRAAGPPPPGFRPGHPSSRAASPAAARGGASPAKPRSRSASPRPAASSSSSRGASQNASPAPRRAPSPAGAATPLGRPSPVPSIARDIRTLAGTDGPPMAPPPSTGGSTPGSRASSASSNPFGSSRSGSTASTASVRSVSSFASFAGNSSAGGSSVASSARSVGSAGSAGSRGRIQPKRKPATQLDFEQQRLQRMARAQQAKEQEMLEKAKRQAQRSKRVACFIIDPKKVEEQKQMREREARERIASDKAEKEAAERAAADAKRSEREQRAAKAQHAEQLALERLRVRKAEERRRAADAAAAEAAEAAERERLEEEKRQAKAEQRRLRAETSFFTRTADGSQPALTPHTSSMVGLMGPMPLS